MSVLGQVIAVFKKDLLIEWRSPIRVSSLFFYAFALVLMVAFTAGTGTVFLRKIAASTLWIGILVSSTRALDQSYTTELEQGALEGLVLWPVDPVAIYYGKALANSLVLLLVMAALTPLTIAIYDVQVSGDLGTVAFFLFFGCTALAAPGTLYGAITAHTRGSSALLPLLMFPMVVPALMAAASGTSAALEGDVMGVTPGWALLLLAFNLIHWSVSGLLFRFVVEDA